MADNEHKYAAVEVVGKAAGMNQFGWEGAIADNECTMLYNMGTHISGEWRKRKGYEWLTTFVIGETPPVLKLHWHTDETTDQADATTWVQSGDEVTAASSGALDVSEDIVKKLYYGGDSTTVWALHGGYDKTSTYIKIKSSFNLDAVAGRLSFLIFIANADGTEQWTSDIRPNKSVYLFYGSANFNVFINTSGDLIWKYGSGSGEYLNAGPVVIENRVAIDLRWDNAVTNVIYPYRFEIYVNDVLAGRADPASAVTLTFDTDVYFLNTGSSGTSAPNHQNWASLTHAVTGGFTSVSTISSWSSSAASAAVDGSVTGIFNNSSQQRAIVTAGVGNATAGVVYYSPSWAVATGTFDLGQTRTSACECQGNLYIVDGTVNLNYLVGAATAISEYVLPETAKWIEEYHGHLCIAGLGTNGAYSVRLSTLDDFVTSSAVSWPSTNQIFKCRDTVRGIKAFAGNLIVGTRSTVESISGYTTQDFAKTIISTGANCASHWSMAECPLLEGNTAGLIWAGYDGIYLLTANEVRKISWSIQPFWDTLSKTEIEESCAVVNQGTGEYMLAVSDGAVAQNNYIVVYNYRKGDWSIWKYKDKIDVLGKYYKDGVETILGGDAAGNLFQLDRSDADGGAAIDGYLTTKWFDGGVPDQDKDFRKLYVWCSSSGEYPITVGWSTDYTDIVGEPSVIEGTSGGDFTCVISHEPSVVVGTDGNDYYCHDAHTSAAATCPITGADYATVWTATGTTGRGTVWTADTAYLANDDKRPITGGQYASYWVPKNTVGEGATWSASAGYKAAGVSMMVMDAIPIDSNSAVFGTAVFGTDVFVSAEKTVVYGVDLYNARGKSIQFMFRTERADQPFQIRGLKAWFTYVPEFPA